MADKHMSHDEVSLLSNLAWDSVQRTSSETLVINRKAETLTFIQFFAKLSELFNHRKGSDHGAIYLTQKRRKSLY